MRLLSHLLFAMAAVVAGCAVLIYAALTTLACGYAPGAASCHARPWDLGGDDRFWLVGLPTGIVGLLIALAILARRRWHRSDDRRDGS
jgi:Mn2+/Fe2+ NRAMP family transporter